LSPPLVERLLDCGLTRLEVSVDAARAETYAAVRPGGDYNKLKRSIDYFLDERSRLGLELPLLRLSFLSLPANETELSAFLESWSGKADLISVQKPIWFPGSALPEPALPEPSLAEPSLAEPKGRSETPREVFSGAAAEPPEEGFCLQPWQRLGVDYDGRLWPCCSWYGEELLGLGADDLSIAKAWRSEAMEALRLAHLKGRLPGPCQECHSRGAF
jgi:MoaA/NifB/PqqE/SkfB family radical SAM enzyme